MGAGCIGSPCGNKRKQQKEGEQAVGARARTQPKACHEIPLPRFGRSPAKNHGFVSSFAPVLKAIGAHDKSSACGMERAESRFAQAGEERPTECPRIPRYALLPVEEHGHADCLMTAARKEMCLPCALKI